MTKNEYIHHFEQMQMSKETKEKMLASILRQQPEEVKKLPHKIFKMPKIAVASVVFTLIMITGISVNATTDGALKKALWELLYGGQYVKEYIKSDVFKASDEHSSISITELLSDEVCIRAVVKIQAKDELGKKWLKDILAEQKDNKKVIPQYHDCMKLRIDGKGNCYGVNKINSGNSENEAVFCLEYEGVDEAALGKKMKAIFDYTLASKIGTTKLDVTCNVPVKEYKLELETGKEISPYYTPKTIRITPLSYVIYGKNHKFIKYSDHARTQTSWISDEESEKECFKKVSVLKSDNQKEELGVSWTLCGMSEEDQKSEKSDIMVVSGLLPIAEMYKNNRKERELQSNIDEYQGIELTNNRNITAIYRFVK